MTEKISEASKQILLKLIKGNKDFMEGKYEAQNICVETLKKFATYQEPHACILSCSDSRVVPELIFGVGIGELFVVRIAGITLGPNVRESIEYAVKALKVPVLILLGHDNCGVMDYAKDCYPDHKENYNALLTSVYPAIETDEKSLESSEYLAKHHTVWLEQHLMEESSIVKEAVEKGDLFIATGHLCHQTGKVYLMNHHFEEITLDNI